jgi:hypothetical protein
MAIWKKHPARFCVVFLAVLSVIFLGSVRPAMAFESPLGPTTPQPQVSPTPQPSPDPTNTNGSTGNSGGTSSNNSGGGNVFTIISQIFVKFANDTVASGLMYGLGTLIRGMAESSAPSFDQGISSSIAKLTTNDMGGSIGTFTSLWEVRYNAWKALLVVASLLLPITLLSSVIYAMRGGMASFTSRSDAKEALVQWITSVALAGSSFFLLYQGFRFSEALNGYIDAHVLTESLSGTGAGTILGTIFGTGVVSSMILALSLVFPPAAAFTGIIIFAFFFVIIGAVFIFVSLALASLAKDVILIIVVAIAPLVCVLSSVQPFRWIFSAWLKVAVAAILLVPGNTLLWRIGSYLVIHAFNNASLMNAGDVFMAILLWIGVASLITGMNFAVGKLVYAAAIEVVQKAGKATMDTAKLALSAVGFASGVGIAGGAGLAGGATASTSTASGTLGAGGVGGGLGSGAAGGLASDPGVLGSFLKSTGIPGLSDFGAGLSSGFGAGNQASLRRGPIPGKSLPDNPQSGVNAAKTTLEGNNATKEDIDRIPQIAEGTQMVEKTLGLSEGTIASSFGFSSHGDMYASTVEKGGAVPHPKEGAPLWDMGNSKIKDAHTTFEAISHFDVPLNSPKVAEVAKAANYSRTRGNDRPQNFIDRASKYNPDEIDNFLTNEKNILRRGGVQYSG